MTEVIKEILYENLFEIETNESFSIALKLKDIMSEFGRLEIRENKLFTASDGSTMILKFESIKDVDKISRIIFYFDILATSERIKIKIAAALNCVFKNEEKNFNSFYKLEIYPDAVEDAKDIINEEVKKIEKILEIS